LHWVPSIFLLNGYHSPLPGGKGGCGVKLITDLHLVLRLGVTGATPLLSLYVFMAQPEIIVSFHRLLLLLLLLSSSSSSSSSNLSLLSLSWETFTYPGICNQRD